MYISKGKQIRQQTFNFNEAIQTFNFNEARQTFNFNEAVCSGDTSCPLLHWSFYVVMIQMFTHNHQMVPNHCLSCGFSRFRAGDCDNRNSNERLPSVPSFTFLI